MKIEHTDTQQNACSIIEIRPGQVFKVQGDDDAFFIRLGVGSSNIFNAVNLETGGPVKFAIDELSFILVPTAKLVV